MGKRAENKCGQICGDEWETVGSPGFSIAEAWTINMGIDAENVPYVVYNDQGDNDNTYLKKWNGS